MANPSGTAPSGFFFTELTPAVKKEIRGVSLPVHAEISTDELRYLRVLHTGFDGKTHSGELIVNRLLADEVLEIFRKLYEKAYPIEKIRLIDHYGADDERSMTDNNSSAFCYRNIAHTQVLSLHSYGCAIDINPLYNPYLADGYVMPAAGAPYADREKNFPHKITREDLCFRIFTEHGWSWGGDWTDEKDYQHFYKDLRERA